MTTLTFNVPDISCSHCVHTIQTELGELAGVRLVQADRETRRVTVGFEPPASQAAIEALLAEIDYPGEVLSPA